MDKLRVVFMGTPIFAKIVLEKLIKEYNVVLVVSQPDKQKDRKGNLIETPTKKIALENNIDVYQPEKIRKEYEYVLSYKPDIIVTCAYGQIIPNEILDYPKYGCINVHGSLLPKYRGGAPIHWAIINGETETGITIMYMSEKMDAGDIISQESITIENEDTLDSLYLKMANLGRDLLIKTLPSIIEGSNNRIKQDESLVTFGFNISKENEKIDFNNNAIDVINKIKGLSSVPGAYTYIDNKRLKIYMAKVLDIPSNGIIGKITNVDKEGIRVSCKDLQILITDIKLEGKKRCLVKEFVNGIDNKDYINKILK